MIQLIRGVWSVAYGGFILHLAVRSLRCNNHDSYTKHRVLYINALSIRLAPRPRRAFDPVYTPSRNPQADLYTS